MPNNNEENICEIFDIQIIRGTIVKVAGHPVKLREHLFIKQVSSNEFKLENHEIMEIEEEILNRDEN